MASINSPRDLITTSLLLVSALLSHWPQSLASVSSLISVHLWVEKLLSKTQLKVEKLQLLPLPLISEVPLLFLLKITITFTQVLMLIFKLLMVKQMFSITESMKNEISVTD